MDRETLASAAEVSHCRDGPQRLKQNQNTARFGTVEPLAEKRKNVVIPKRSEEPAFICVLKRKRVPPPGEDAGRSE
jgi:hypothetical protein